MVNYIYLCVCVFVCALVLYRKDFRQAFKLIGELRSLIPTTTNVLACTATATVAIYEEVTKVLALENPHVVALTPDRANITYSVLPKQEFDRIVEAICTKLSKLVTPLQFPKTVIFCQRYACVCVCICTFYRLVNQDSVPYSGVAHSKNVYFI